MQQLHGQHVLILGLGASGLAMARWCARAGADVTVADTRETPPQLATLQAEWPQVKFVSGAFAASLVQGTSVRAVFRSPGLSPEVVASRGLFREGVVTRLVQDHRANRFDGTDILLALMNLEIWSRIYLDGRDTTDVAAELKGLAA